MLHGENKLVIYKTKLSNLIYQSSSEPSLYSWCSYSCHTSVKITFEFFTTRSLYSTKPASPRFCVRSTHVQCVLRAHAIRPLHLPRLLLTYYLPVIHRTPSVYCANVLQSLFHHLFICTRVTNGRTSPSCFLYYCFHPTRNYLRLFLQDYSSAYYPKIKTKPMQSSHHAPSAF